MILQFKILNNALIPSRKNCINLFVVSSQRFYQHRHSGWANRGKSYGAPNKKFTARNQRHSRSN